MAESEAFKGVFDQKHLRKDVVHAENIYWRSDYPLETWKNPPFIFASLITNNLRITSGRCLAIVRELALGFFLSKSTRFSEV
jgi:hypothetical protein